MIMQRRKEESLYGKGEGRNFMSTSSLRLCPFATFHELLIATL